MKRGLLYLLLFVLTFPLWPQAANPGIDEQYSYVGMTLAELIGRFGPPRTVGTARGNELWQDDVVFQYPQGDFYIYRDRVWQVRLVSIRGVSNGDRKAAVQFYLGNTAEDMGDHLLFPVSGSDWPLMLRVNFSNSGLVSGIFLYRPDF